MKPFSDDGKSGLMPATGKRVGSWTVRLALWGTAGWTAGAGGGLGAAAGAVVAAAAGAVVDAGAAVGLAGAGVGAAAGGGLCAGAHAWSRAIPPKATPAAASRT